MVGFQHLGPLEFTDQNPLKRPEDPRCKDANQSWATMILKLLAMLHRLQAFSCGQLRKSMM